MQFIYTKPDLKTFRGHEFFGGNPVTILDEHTGTLLRLNPDFRMVQDEPVIVPRETPKGLHGREILTVKNKGGRPKKKVQ